MGNTASYVTAGKPATTGAVYVSDEVTTTLPTTAGETIDSTVFTCVGYISDAGVTNSNTRTTEKVKAWGGDTVLNTQTEKNDDWKFKMIEALNTTVLEVVHGSDNVSGDLSTGITVAVNSDELEYRSWVIDQIFTDGTLNRIVIPEAKVSEIADVVYNDTEPVGYEVTVSPVPDSSGNTHYEYKLAV